MVEMADCVGLGRRLAALGYSAEELEDWHASAAASARPIHATVDLLRGRFPRSRPPGGQGGGSRPDTWIAGGSAAAGCQPPATPADAPVPVQRIEGPEGERPGMAAFGGSKGESAARSGGGGKYDAAAATGAVLRLPSEAAAAAAAAVTSTAGIRRADTLAGLGQGVWPNGALAEADSAKEARALYAALQAEERRAAAAAAAAAAAEAGNRHDRDSKSRNEGNPLSESEKCVVAPGAGPQDGVPLERCSTFLFRYVMHAEEHT